MHQVAYMLFKCLLATDVCLLKNFKYAPTTPLLSILVDSMAVVPQERSVDKDFSFTGRSYSNV